ncbi:hypothetical protein AB1Y20_000490 [Prymnesium parvum]|uniref:Altered inheritance of mitochondria protein 24, mitochondrial n=1 Tax=Prymnesium parvum TaxID=97485 RepID=A0AB34K9N4_PRYPA
MFPTLPPAKGEATMISGMQLISQPKGVRTVNGVQFQIIGSDAQTVEVNLMPQQIMRCEPGAMVHLHDGLTPKIGTDGGCRQACIRCCCVGESFFRLTYENTTSLPTPMAISASWPAKLLAFDLSTYRGLHIANGSFVGAVSSDVRFNLRMAKSVGAACCGGQGLLFNEMNGDGVAFLCGGGALIEKTLGPGEKLVLDTLSLLAWEPSVQMSVRTAGGCLMCCCGGEGFFLTEMTGPRKVWVQPMPLKKMRRAFASAGQSGQSGRSADMV